jgi:hypothetical protein
MVAQGSRTIFTEVLWGRAAGVIKAPGGGSSPSPVARRTGGRRVTARTARQSAQQQSPRLGKGSSSITLYHPVTGDFQPADRSAACQLLILSSLGLPAIQWRFWARARRGAPSWRCSRPPCWRRSLWAALPTSRIAPLTRSCVRNSTESEFAGQRSPTCGRHRRRSIAPPPPANSPRRAARSHARDRRREIERWYPINLPVSNYSENCATEDNYDCADIAESNSTGCGLYDLARRLCSAPGGNQVSRCGAQAQNFVYYDYVGCHPEPWGKNYEQGHVFNIAVPPVRLRHRCARAAHAEECGAASFKQPAVADRRIVGRCGGPPLNAACPSAPAGARHRGRRGQPGGCQPHAAVLQADVARVPRQQDGHVPTRRLPGGPRRALHQCRQPPRNAPDGGRGLAFGGGVGLGGGVNGWGLLGVDGPWATQHQVRQRLLQATGTRTQHTRLRTRASAHARSSHEPDRAALPGSAHPAAPPSTYTRACGARRRSRRACEE